MNPIVNQIAKLGIESTKTIKNGDIYTEVEQDLKHKGDPVIQTIVEFVDTHPEDIKGLQVGSRTITLTAKLIAVGGAMALALYGDKARPALKDLILRQSDVQIRQQMIKKIHQLDIDWVHTAIAELTAYVDDTTADFIRNLKVDTATSLMYPSVSNIDRWIKALSDTNEQHKALIKLTEFTTLIKLNENPAQAQRAAQAAAPLVKQAAEPDYQIKAAQLVFRYSPNIDLWIDALSYLEEKYMDTTIPTAERSEILEVINTNLDRLAYRTDAANILQQSIIEFIKQNTSYDLEVAALKILITNHLSKPPKGFLVRNKATDEKASLTCAECGIAVRPSHAIRVSLIRDKVFCSQQCSTAYVMRTRGSMNPRNW